MHTVKYTPNGALHHLLSGIKTMIAGSSEATCTRIQINTWARLNPCQVESVDLQHLLDRLAADRHIEVIATGQSGLSAADQSNTRVKLLGSGLLVLSKLNVQRKTPAPKGAIAGRKSPIQGHANPINSTPVQRAGSEEFKRIPSRSGDSSTQYDAGQGLGAAL